MPQHISRRFGLDRAICPRTMSYCGRGDEIAPLAYMWAGRLPAYRFVKWRTLSSSAVHHQLQHQLSSSLFRLAYAARLNCGASLRPRRHRISAARRVTRLPSSLRSMICYSAAAGGIPRGAVFRHINIAAVASVGKSAYAGIIRIRRRVDKLIMRIVAARNARCHISPGFLLEAFFIVSVFAMASSLAMVARMK